MNIEYRPTDSDYVAAQTAWLLRHPRALGRSLIPLAMVALLVVLVPIRIALHPEQWREVLPGLGWIIWPVGSYLFLRWRWRKQFAKSPLANTDMSTSVDERGVTLSATVSRTLSTSPTGAMKVTDQNRIRSPAACIRYIVSSLFKCSITLS